MAVDRAGIKGSVLKGIVEHAREVVRQKGIGDVELKRRLGAEAVQLFHSEIVAASWYPMSFYGPLRKLLREVEGGGDDEYTIERAAESARKLIASGIYPQLTYLKEWKDHVPLADPEANAVARRKLFEGQLARVCTVYNSLFNFATTQIVQDPEHADRVRLEYRDGGRMPYDGRLAVLGFWQEISLHWSKSRRGELWTKIDAYDHYVLRMTRDIGEI